MKKHGKTEVPRKQELNNWLIELGCKTHTLKRHKKPKHKRFNREEFDDDK